MEKKNSQFLNNSQFSLQIWANWGCLRGAQFLVNNFLNYKKKHVVRKIWPIRIRVRYLKLVKLFSTCVFFHQCHLSRSNRPIFSDFSDFYKKLAKLAKVVWCDFFSTSTSEHPKRLAYSHREFISVQEPTICFNKK